jgi:uncharacterized membrane protein
MPIHLFFIHFPIALIVLGAAADVLGAIFRSDATRRWAGVVLILGGAFALAAFVTGESPYSTLQPPMRGAPRILDHTQWGALGAWLLAAAGAWRAAWRTNLRGARGWTMLTVAVLSALLVVGIANSGMAIVHG